MISRLAQFFFSLTLVLLPMIGFGTVYLVTGHDTGAGFQPAYLTMAAVILLGLLGTFQKNKNIAALFGGLTNAIARPFMVIIFCTLGVVLLSAFGTRIAPVAENSSMVWGRFLRQFIQLLIMGSFTVFIAVYLKTSPGDTQQRWQMFSRFLIFGALVQVLYGVFQEIHYFHPLAFFPGLDQIFTSNQAILSGSESLYLGNAFQNVPRLRGTACEPLYLGNYLLLVWPFVFLTGWSRPWRWLVLFLLMGLLVLTWSRGAWLGFFLQVGLLFLFYLRSSGFLRGKKKGLGRGHVIFLVVLVFVLGFVFLFGTGREWLTFPVERMRQAFSSQDWSNLTRLYSMQAAWRAYLLSPVFGVGWGQFAWHFPILVDPMGLQSQFTWPVVNNYPLQVLCETGGLGLAVFLLSGWYLLKKGIAACRNQKLLSIPVLSVIATCGVWIQLLTFSQYNLPHIWVALAPLAAVAFQPSTPDKSQEPL